MSTPSSGKPRNCGTKNFDNFFPRPYRGETRIINMEKSSEPLGIQINKGDRSGGIFVCSVSDNSLAKEAGVQVGDQLLEVTGFLRFF